MEKEMLDDEDKEREREVVGIARASTLTRGVARL